MPIRARRLLVSAALLGFAAGCAHRPGPEKSAAFSAAIAADSRSAAPAIAPAVRRSTPGTPFTRALPDTPFSPILVVTTQVAREDFFVHNIAGVGPRYHPTEKLYRGQRAYVLPLARNYAFDALERADLTYELIVQKPDGTRDGAPFMASLWQDTVAAPDLLLYPATTVVFHTEATDPVGPYRFMVRIHDHLGGDTRQIEHAVTLEDYAPPTLPADFDPDAWFNGYYLQPTPELALPALARFFKKLPADKRAGALPPLLGFYDQILTDNPWLLPAFAARLAAAEPDEAYALSLALGFHLRSASAAPAGLDRALWERLAVFRSHTWPSDPDAELLQPSQLDALWGRFFASALQAPVRRLLDPLAYSEDLGAAERWRKTLASASPGEAPALPDLDDPSTPLAVRREVMLRTALWSLRANARQHPLVRGYLEQTLRAGDLAPGIRALLERALRPDAPPGPAVAAPAS